MRTIDAEERRARLARRHRLAAGERARDLVDAARSVVCLHGTDPATVYLSAWARVEAMDVDAVDGALYRERSLVKHLAMRRTLFVFPRATLGAAQAGASERVADTERRRLVRDVERARLHADGERWLQEACAEVLAALAGAGQVVRASNAGAWFTSRPRWALMEAWLGEPLEAPPEAEGVAALVAAWLRAFGPGTAADLKWWLGSTVKAVRMALADVGAVEVDLDGKAGYLMPDDLEPVERVAPWAALLPPLDPTTMGWQERDWYLGPHRAQLFDAAGNAGPTIWWDGRTVGGWRQDEAGDVVVQMLEDVGGDALHAIEHEAARLTDWLGGTRVLPRFPSPLFRAA